jgi:hypothetical protein
MQQFGENGMRPRMGRALECVAAALLFAVALSHSDLAHAAHGGGGFHGGFQGRTGFAGVHRGFGSGFHVRRHLGYGLLGGGLEEGLLPDYGDYDYDYDYDYDQPYAFQYRYYCSDPAGYYPQVMQCNTAWQTVPAS